MDLLTNHLQSVKNQCFIDKFTIEFQNKHGKVADHILKDLEHTANPLVKLLDIDGKCIEQKHLLARNLIESLTSTIQISRKYFMDSVFHHPSSTTLVYASLFDDSLKACSIHGTIKKMLDEQLKIWKENMFPPEVLVWSKLSTEQRQICNKIWQTIIQSSSQEQDSVDALFRQNEKVVQQIMNEYQQLVDSLKQYCQQAIDFKEITDILQQWRNKFNESIIGSVKMPDTLQTLLHLANQLNSYANVNSWMSFLRSNQDKTSKNREICQ